MTSERVRGTPDPPEGLRALRREAEERLRAREAELAAVARARLDDTADDEHDPEGATLSGEWSRLEGLRAEAERRLDRIRIAQERVASGAYGICERCGEPIPESRMAAVPTATRCVSCASLAG